MAIERSLPFLRTIKKVREKRGGGGGYSRGNSGKGAYSRENDMSCRTDLTVSGVYGHSSLSKCEQLE